MPNLSDLAAGLIDRAAAGPLSGPLRLAVAAFEGRDPFKLLRLACLTAFCLPALWSSQSWAFYLNKCLAVWFHEAGHGVFFPVAGWHPVGTFMVSAGGSIMQIAVVFMFMVVAWLSGKRFDAMLMWLWAGLNFVDVSLYAGDARDRAMPLIFGMDKSAHDWGNMLTMTGLLWATPAIAGAIWLLGAACFVLAVVGGFLTAEQE